MEQLKYRGRLISSHDILYIRDLIAANPQESRRTLSKKLCEAWQWKQANGALRDMVCRGLLLMLERAGHIELPPVKFVPHNPLARRVRPSPMWIDKTPVESSLDQIQPLEFVQVRRRADESLFNSLIEEHHYLGYEQPVGEHLKYLVWAQGRPIACIAWSSAPRHIGARDRYIGWSQPARQRNIRFLAYNTRFLILPGCVSSIWRRTSLARWRHESQKTGSRCTGIRFTSWKHSWIRSDSVEPVIVRRTGWCWATRPDEASNPTATSRTARSNRCWAIR